MVFDYCGKTLDRGQIFKLQEAPNDEALTRLKYAQELPPGASTYECRVCGGRFQSSALRDAHGSLRHSGLEGDDLAEALEQEQGRAAAATPLDLTQTRASRESGDAVIEIREPLRTKSSSKAKAGRARAGRAAAA